jgi:hypothetical protein
MHCISGGIGDIFCCIVGVLFGGVISCSVELLQIHHKCCVVFWFVSVYFLNFERGWHFRQLPSQFCSKTIVFFYVLT